mmetsp:Transcript_37809/g.122235  ORF Transcript_37809/g.122235 Transcript_37809/m.122235 type:complete len:262 (-) Transcript_37809:495-1280(-)
MGLSVHLTCQLRSRGSVSSGAKFASLSWLLAHAPTAAVAGLSGHLKVRDGRDGRREASGVDACLVRCEEPNGLHVRAHAHHAAAQPLGGHRHGARVLLDADDERVRGGEREDGGAAARVRGHDEGVEGVAPQVARERPLGAVEQARCAREVGEDTRQEGVAELLGARPRREARLEPERRKRGRVRARQPQLLGDEVGDDRLGASDRVDAIACAIGGKHLLVLVVREARDDGDRGAPRRLQPPRRREQRVRPPQRPPRSSRR